MKIDAETVPIYYRVVLKDSDGEVYFSHVIPMLERHLKEFVSKVVAEMPSDNTYDIYPA